MDWWSCSRMRGDHKPRSWMRWGELVERCRSERMVLSTNDIRKACRSVGMPEKRYGHYRFEERHYMAVRAYAEREGLIEREVSHV